MKLTKIFALAIAAAAISALTTPAFAQTADTARARQTAAQSYNLQSSGMHAFAYSPQSPIVSSDGSAVPGHVLATPEKCWTDDGNGRWSSCDVGGN